MGAAGAGGAACGGPVAAAGAGLLVLPVTGLPEVVAGDDLGTLIAGALQDALAGCPGAGSTVRDGDVVVVTSKIVSKAGGLRISAERRMVATLEESVRVVAERSGPGGVSRIVEALAGPVLAAAGVDASNTGEDPGPQATALLLPRDPDAEATRLLGRLRDALAGPGGHAPALGLIISDTAGRPWRTGQTDFALGAAGIRVLVDHRGEVDDDGRPMLVTARAVADELAAAADLVKGKTRRVPVALIRGAAELVAAAPGAAGVVPEGGVGTGARALVRTGAGDWFAYGHAEAVRRALGIEPGTPAALETGIAPASPAHERREARIERACAVALHPQGLGTLPGTHPRAHLMRDTTDLSRVRATVIQYGLRVEAPDPFTLGVAVGRLLAALAGEDVPARLAGRDDTPSPSGRARASALLLFA